MTISIFGHRHPLMWVDQSESWFPAKHAHVRRHQTQHILCQQRLSYLRSTSNYFLVVAWFFYFFIEKEDFFSKIQTFWRKRRPYLCVFFKKVLFADQSPLKRTQLVSLQCSQRVLQGRWYTGNPCHKRRKICQPGSLYTEDLIWRNSRQF